MAFLIGIWYYLTKLNDIIKMLVQPVYNVSGENI